MLSKRTIIGLIVGSAIIAIGGYSLLTHIGPLTVYEDYTVAIGDSMSYTIPAPNHTLPKRINSGLDSSSRW